ncbi:hypothetical protein, partial [Escherichia coli]|uniref:hypothetical protein n=1 Tax=Escherichia coli TaxID=562 RepID=UPI00301D6E01
VGQRNVEQARRLLDLHHLHCHNFHVEGVGYRTVVFDLGAMAMLCAKVEHYVGQRNVEQARRLLDLHHLHCHNFHVEGVGYRTVVFDLGAMAMLCAKV